MIIFWIIIALMTVLALGFVVIPLLRVRKSVSPSSKQLHVALYRERLQTLTEQYQQSAITFEDYTQSQTELNDSLLADVPEQEPEIIHRHSSRWLAIVFTIVLPLIAITLYWHWGDSRQVSAWRKSQREATVVQAEIHQLGSVANIISALQQRLEQDPKSVQGWYLLGKLYFSQRQFQNSVVALQNAYQIKPNNPHILLQYAESLFFLHDRHIDTRATALLNQLLKISPGNMNGINLLALGAYRGGDYQSAINYWRQLLPKFAPNSIDAQNLSTMIAMAEQKMGHKIADVSLSVKVTLSPALKQKTVPNDTVFIYALATNGPQMPLAIVRKQVKDLPVSVTLDSTKAMVASMSLNNFKQVRVIARISKSGQALPQAGDLEGGSGVINTQDKKKNIQIQINQVVK